MSRLPALAAVLLCAVSHAAPLRPSEVPEPLRAWTQWALHGHEEQALCPRQLGADARTCTFAGSLELSLEDKGGRFTLKAWAAREDWLLLPGDGAHWPQGVTVDGKAAVVTEEEELPRLRLSPGSHTVSGRFAWASLPEALAVPEETGLLRLSLRGKDVPFPGREGAQVFLQRQASDEAEGEGLEVRVYRKVVDAVPLQLTTRVELDVSGKGRELLLGRALPAGFVPLSLEGELPVRLEPDGRLRVQARAGRFALTLVARHEGPVSSLKRPEADGPWAADEVWVFEAQPKLRQVVVEGVAALDASQTTLPGEWRSLPAWGVGPSDELKLVERQRGQAEAEPDLLNLQRSLWLDFDGRGYTVQDTLGGQLRRSWRLDMQPPATLGRVVSSGVDQLITRAGPGQPSGVELREGRLQVQADSRVDGALRQLPAVGWDADFQSVSAVLNLPPGWRLFYASGADDIPGTWVRGWTLLQIFLVVITALSVGRLYGRGWGLLALLALVLLFPERDAPHEVWLAVLGLEALSRVLPEARLQRVAQVLRLGAWGVVLLLSLSFLVDHVRHGLFPALSRPSHGSTGWMSRTATFEEPTTAAAPMAPPGAEQVDGEAPEEMQRGGGYSGIRQRLGASADNLADAVGSSPVRAKKQSLVQAYDKTAQVQTGPGLPQWKWDQVRIQFNGPVQRGQVLELWLLSPAMNLALALLRAALLVALLLLTLGVPLATWRRLGAGGGSAAAGLLLAVGVGLWAVPAHAEDVPPQPMLDALRDRLLEAPACAPGCADISSMGLLARGGTLQLRMEVHAEAAVAVPLPGNAGQWLPSSVKVDGSEASTLRRTPDGTLWLAVKEGLHTVSAEGPLPERETVTLSLPLQPRRVESQLDGWRLDGVREDGEPEEGLQLSRLQKKRADAPTAALEVGNLPPFLVVSRTLQLGLQWTVTTEVTRLSPAGSPLVLEVPLLQGESVTSPGVRVQGGKVQLNLPPDGSSLSWTSVLEPAAALQLKAPEATAWTEVWRLEVGPTWHVTPSGIPPVHPGSDGDRAPEWRPWPGETVSLAVARPEAVPGQTLTADRGELRVAPGLRATDSTLSLNVRSSRGGLHPVTLPEGAELLGVKVNGQLQPLRLEGRTVNLPLTPGAQAFELQFRETRGITAAWRSPEVSAGLPVVNAELQVSLPERWVLFVSGPRLGPAVLFWSTLLVLLLVGLGLGRSRLSPLGTGEWLLLLLGLSQVPLVAGAVVVLWLLALAWRGRTPTLGQYRWAFPLRQLALAGWGLVAVGVLTWAIQHGLLGRPDMQVEGNDSSAQLLRWFEDRSAGTWPQGFVLSVPLMAYRLAMLAWALWLARALLRWVRWAWGAFTAGGLFVEPAPAAPVAPVSPPAAASPGDSPVPPSGG
ncbi:MAG: hypothetical protein RL653_1056 [Pseudomonadota bacterium]|jgi:hypothetical protein